MAESKLKMNDTLKKIFCKESYRRGTEDPQSDRRTMMQKPTAPQLV